MLIGKLATNNIGLAALMSPKLTDFIDRLSTDRLSRCRVAV